MTEKKIEKILVDNYGFIKRVLTDYEDGVIGIQEAMYCMCGIIEIILKKVK